MRRRKRKTVSEFDMVPINIIDLFLVMLIFFMTTTTFFKVKSINIELPGSKTAIKERPASIVSLNIRKDGRFFLDSKECDYNELLTELKRANKRDTLFLIGADKNSKHSDFIKALDALSLAGISEISIATEEVKGV